LAAAYTAYVLDVYDHYRWRCRVYQAWEEGRLNRAWAGLEKKDVWQDKYFDPDSPALRGFSFWAAL
jgi:hypothetical protein